MTHIHAGRNNVSSALRVFALFVAGLLAAGWLFLSGTAGGAAPDGFAVRVDSSPAAFAGEITLSGSVTYTPSGAPASGVTVTLKKTVYNVTPNIVTTRTTTTDQDGRYSFQVEPRCSVVYGVVAQSSELVDGEPVPPSPESSSSGCVLSDFSINPKISRPVPIVLDGYVKDSSGAPVSGVTVTVTKNKYNYEPDVITTHTVSTDGGGHYSFEAWSRCSIAYEFRPSSPGRTFSPPAMSTSGCINTSRTMSDFTLRDPEVDRLQYSDGANFVDVTGTLYVLKGTTVTFKAKPRPADATWPSGKPIWGGTSGATGTGETKAVAFSTVSTSATHYQTVTARTSNTVTANVVVYDVTGVLTPQDNFAGRNQNSYGLKEKVNLSFTRTPALTAAQMGGLRWKITAGGGEVGGTETGVDIYTAPKTAGGVTLKLEVVTGPSKGLGPTYERTIVAPADAYMTQKPGTVVRHCQGYSSVGFWGNVFMLPKDVSFSNLFFREGGGEMEASGFYVNEDGRQHDFTSFMTPVRDCNATAGCKAFEDEVWTGAWPPPFTPGVADWPIDWLYAFANDLDPTFSGETKFTVANHHQTSDAAGTATIEKKGAGPYTKAAADPDADCP